MNIASFFLDLTIDIASVIISFLATALKLLKDFVCKLKIDVSRRCCTLQLSSNGAICAKRSRMFTVILSRQLLFFIYFFIIFFYYNSPLSKKELDIHLTYLHRPSSTDRQRYRVRRADVLVISQPFEVYLLSTQNDRH